MDSIMAYSMVGLLCSLVVRVSDLQLDGRESYFWPLHYLGCVT